MRDTASTVVMNIDYLTTKISSTLMQTLGSMFAPSGDYAKLLVVTYHRVLEEPDSLLCGEVDAETFTWQMSLLSKLFNVLPLTEAVQRLENGTLPSRAACVTFDDGYADNFDVALPILKEYCIPATFFIVTGVLNGGRMWNDTVIETVRRAKGDYLNLSCIGLNNTLIKTLEYKRQAITDVINHLKYQDFNKRNDSVNKLAGLVSGSLPNNLMMTTEQVLKLVEAGMDVGAHTVSHPILAKIPLFQATKEIAKSKNELQDIVSREVKSFAFPNGRPRHDYMKIHADAVRDAGFEYSLSTSWGFASKHSDRFQLPRISFWGNGSVNFTFRILKTYLKNTIEYA